MKFSRILLLLLFSLLISRPLLAQVSEDPPPVPSYEPENDVGGWFLGSDQGVLFFVGNSSRFVNAQYYGTVFGGYNFKGYFQPMLRIGQALGTLGSFFNPTSFFLTFEGGFRVTPLRTKVRPYFVGTAGGYVLSVDDYASPVRSGVNFTFSGGGGIEYNFGHNTIGLGSAYRGFINSGADLKSVEVTLGYTFTF